VLGSHSPPAALRSSSPRASLSASPRGTFSELDYADYLGEDDGASPFSAASAAAIAKRLLDQALWKYTSVLLAQPFEVAKTVLQCHVIEDDETGEESMRRRDADGRIDGSYDSVNILPFFLNPFPRLFTCLKPPFPPSSPCTTFYISFSGKKKPEEEKELQLIRQAQAYTEYAEYDDDDNNGFYGDGGDDSDIDERAYFTPTVPAPQTHAHAHPHASGSSRTPSPSRRGYPPETSSSRHHHHQRLHRKPPRPHPFSALSPTPSRSRPRRGLAPSPPPPPYRLDLRRRPYSLLEVISQLWQKEGAAAVWKGANATFLYSVLLKTLESWTRSVLAAVLNVPDPGVIPRLGVGASAAASLADSAQPLTSLGIAVAAAGIAGIILAPLDIIRTR
jgi:fusion and transport protein UGO1